MPAKKDEEYKIIVDVDKGTWADMDLAGDLERVEHEGTRAGMLRDRALRKLEKAKGNEGASEEEIIQLEDDYMEKYDEYMESIKGLEKIKDKMIGMIDRMAAVTVNGKLTMAEKLPYHIVVQVQGEISKAQQEARNPKN